eukprot:gnl/MRDRNA2_/MRDRNA2_79854_c0_seq1.p1 gnl/MRDRNA2_/MRDRNA2_79854_c0~~gnl/MRDRNA2_/MRDRNA2_79854_c0_seq1.p1  ORF type:complete len:1066 (-),score=188.42 gnl/MRDRNA2_/MRDRNA2_79854_c0_seq1:26-3223(-)
MAASNRLQRNVKKDNRPFERLLPPISNPSRKRLNLVAHQTCQTWRSPGWSSQTRDYNRDALTGRALPSWDNRFHVDGSGRDTRFSHVSRRHYFDSLATSTMTSAAPSRSHSPMSQSSSRLGFHQSASSATPSSRFGGQQSASSIRKAAQTWLNSEVDTVQDSVRGNGHSTSRAKQDAKETPRHLVPLVPSANMSSEVSVLSIASSDPTDYTVEGWHNTCISGPYPILPVIAESNQPIQAATSEETATPLPDEIPLPSHGTLNQNSVGTGSTRKLCERPQGLQPTNALSSPASSSIEQDNIPGQSLDGTDSSQSLADGRRRSRPEVLECTSSECLQELIELEEEANSPRSDTLDTRMTEVVKEKDGTKSLRIIPDHLRLRTGNTQRFSLAEGFHIEFSQLEQEIIHGYFDLHDLDGSNSLSLEELMKVVQDLGKTPESGSQNSQAMYLLLLKHDEDGSNELDFGEFIKFLASYYQAVYRRMYEKYADEETGMVEKPSLKPMLLEMQQAGFKCDSEELAAIFLNIDQDGDGHLDFPEFCDFMSEFRSLEFKFIQNSAGFAAVELECLQNIFEDTDEDNSGTLNIGEVVKLLEKTLLGSAVHCQEEIEKIVQLFARLDKDKSMTLDFQEFLKLLRVRSNDRTAVNIMSSLKDWDKRKGQTARQETKKDKIAMARLSVLRTRTDRIARIIQPEATNSVDTQGAIAKLASKCQQDAVELEIEDRLLASHWNVHLEEVRALRESFEFCDIDGSECIDRKELRIVFKTLGWPTYTDWQKEALEKCLARPEYQGDLDFAHTLQFVLAYNNEIAHKILAEMGSGDAGFPVDQLVPALYQVGQYLSKAAAQDLLKQAVGKTDPSSIEHINEKTFLSMLHIAREQKMTAWRETCGFSSKELRRFREICDKHTETVEGQEEGFIQLSRMRVNAVLEDLGFSLVPEVQNAVTRALLRVDREGLGKMSFRDILLVLRHLKNVEKVQVVGQELKAAKDAGLDSEATTQLREVFAAYETTGTEKVRLADIHKLMWELGTVVTPSQKKQLQTVMLELAGEDRDGLNFAQFLQTLHRLELNGL